jgi:hypothetical protein
LAEFEAIVTAARSLAPLTPSEGLNERVLQAIGSRQESREILSNLRYKLTLAGVAFMVTSAAIFFVIGPPASRAPSFTGSQDSLRPGSLSAPDFYSHPETKVKSFPVPEGSDPGQLTGQEQLVPNDSVRPSQYILPNVQKVSENVNGRF